MKKITSILLAAAVLCAFTSQAQVTHRCASHTYLKQLDAKYPGFEQSVKDLSQYSTEKKRSTLITIPVVVHIVYKSSTENLSNDYINAQIALLNASFRRTNSDTTNLRSTFSSIVGPANIQFLLAQVKRASTTVPKFNFIQTWFGNQADDVKFSSAGGSDAVSPNKYLNIWVCDLGDDNGDDGLLGYAYPPNGLPNWSGTYPGVGAPEDGVVIDYMAFGGNAKKPLANLIYGAQGKIAVHEVGHYLGLRHIWGDDDGACQGDIGFDDDGVGDTPHAADLSNFDCNKTKNTCTQPADKPDMVENYMDYSLESCQNSFTKQQIALMEGVLANQRKLIRVPLSVETLDLSSHVSVYPNPASDKVYVSLYNVDYDKATIKFVNALGQTVLSDNITSAQTTLSFNTQHLPKGIYFLDVTLNNKQGHTKQKVWIQ